MTKKPWNAGKSVGQKIKIFFKALFCRHDFSYKVVCKEDRLAIWEGANCIKREYGYQCDKCNKIKFHATF